MKGMDLKVKEKAPSLPAQPKTEPQHDEAMKALIRISHDLRTLVHDIPKLIVEHSGDWKEGVSPLIKSVEDALRSLPKPDERVPKRLDDVVGISVQIRNSIERLSKVTEGLKKEDVPENPIVSREIVRQGDDISEIRTKHKDGKVCIEKIYRDPLGTITRVEYSYE